MSEQGPRLSDEEQQAFDANMHEGYGDGQPIARPALDLQPDIEDQPGEA